MNLADFERRWAAAIMAGFSATDAGDALVGDATVDYLGAADTMSAEGTASAALGLRAAIWLAAHAPLWMHGRAHTIDEVRPAERAAMLARMVSHRTYFVRGLATLLKMTTALALMHSPAVRARTHYERRAEPARRALPLVTSQGS